MATVEHTFGSQDHEILLNLAKVLRILGIAFLLNALVSAFGLLINLEKFWFVNGFSASMMWTLFRSTKDTLVNGYVGYEMYVSNRQFRGIVNRKKDAVPTLMSGLRHLGAALDRIKMPLFIGAAMTAFQYYKEYTDVIKA